MNYITEIHTNATIRLLLFFKFISILPKRLTFIRQYLFLSNKSFLGSGNVLWAILCLLMVYGWWYISFMCVWNMFSCLFQIFINTNTRPYDSEAPLIICKLLKLRTYPGIYTGTSLSWYFRRNVKFTAQLFFEKLKVSLKLQKTREEDSCLLKMLLSKLVQRL